MILVVGSTGILGSEIVRQLREQNQPVRALVRKTSDPQKVAQELKSAGPWDSVLGPIAFDKKGDITKSDYVFYIWHNGAYHMM